MHIGNNGTTVASQCVEALEHAVWWMQWGIASPNS